MPREDGTDGTDREFRMVLDRATAELPALPDLVPGAVRRGRRLRLRSRAVMGAVGLGSVAALAVPTLLLAPWAGTDTTRAGGSRSGELPLIPANWPTDQPLAAPTTAYPTVHVPPTEKGKVKEPTRAEAELRYAFKQKLADVLTGLLPADAGRMVIPDDGMNSYRLVSGDKTYNITVRVDSPIGPAGATAQAGPGDGAWLAGNKPCAERAPQNPPLPCVDGKLPDGRVISVGHIATAKGGESGDKGAVAAPSTPIAHFEYHGVQVMFTLFRDERTDSAPPVGNEQVLRVVTDPTFLEAVDFWRTHPM
ncbi:hypothetical protein OG948_15050 [Embleya sp. NBC_00888]|uniref:hypothetical protein n=1 Tax=Embleya sp. NBC_00888 TaxID=2975960 RepID=UPI00386EC040|nr:hypothetical protein OG948_15050 [Embleya sp. NBC_00888]